VTEARFLPRYTNTKPAAGLPSSTDSARPHHRRHHILIFISCYHSRHNQILISIFSASHERGTSTVKFDGYWLLYEEQISDFSSMFIRINLLAPNSLIIYRAESGTCWQLLFRNLILCSSCLPQEEQQLFFYSFVCHFSCTFEVSIEVRNELEQVNVVYGSA
jgi:hypothetical protein